jgi:hypothetical protein
MNRTPLCFRLPLNASGDTFKMSRDSRSKRRDRLAAGRPSTMTIPGQGSATRFTSVRDGCPGSTLLSALFPASDALMTIRASVVLALLLLLVTASPASAQNYSFDARRIALGGAAGTPNVASGLVERQRRYKSFVIPIGLVRVVKNISVFYPKRGDFDFSSAVEFATRPFHWVVGGVEDYPGFKTLFQDIRDARLNSDPNNYSGFETSRLDFVEGLIAPNWGYTFMLQENDRSFQGIYVGAGPYISVRADWNVSSAFAQILDGSGNTYVPEATLGLGGGSRQQTALDITGGYHARFPLFVGDGDEARRNGMYVVAKYHYLHGFRYDEVSADLSLETDNAGLVLPNQPGPPFRMDWESSRSGRGLALDFGVAFVVNRWDFGGGVSGVANRLTWREITRHDVALFNVQDGSEFVHIKIPPLPGVTKRIELPVTYTGDIAYHQEKWSLYNEYSRGFQGNNFRTALEYRLDKVELRGAARMAQGDWFASGGAGFNLTRTLGLDVAAFGTQTFLEADRHLAVAFSLRIDKR